MDIITHAKLFATQRHVLDNHQLYGGVLPYTHHLEAVERVIRRFGVPAAVDAAPGQWKEDVNLLAAAWLHDVVEDTRGRPNEVRAREIEEIFGEDIAMLVGAVTSENGENRKIRNALTYPKIRAAGERAIALKLADRIANVEYGGKSGSLGGMYSREYPDFRHALHTTEPASLYLVNQMWHHLDTLLKPGPAL